MFNSVRESKKADLSLARELLIYYDEFTEFNEQCAFLCDAYASMAARSEHHDEHSVRGLEQSTHWLKSRVQLLKDDLRKIQERVSLEVVPLAEEKR